MSLCMNYLFHNINLGIFMQNKIVYLYTFCSKMKHQETLAKPYCIASLKRCKDIQIWSLTIDYRNYVGILKRNNYKKWFIIFHCY